MSCLLVATALLVLQQRREIEGAWRVARAMRPAADRAVVQDRLVGTALRLPPMVPLRSVSPEVTHDAHRSLYWFVDTETCRRCLRTLGPWNDLALAPNLDRHLVLFGDSLSAVSASVRALVGTAVWHAERGEIEAALGGAILANMRLLVSHDGVVLLADARGAEQGCGWSVEAQVGALMGFAPSSMIRYDLTDKE